MSAATYTGLELRRSLRNRRFFIFSLAVPVIFLIIFGTSTGGSSGDFSGTGISAMAFYLGGLVSFSAMSAMIGGGARISAERVTGWNRQLRLTPLKPTTYFASKILVSYTVLLMSVVLLSVVALAFGAKLQALHWVEMLGLVALAAIPFAGFGIGIGHLLKPDSIGPVLGTSVGLLAFLGGTWYPPTGTLATIGKLLPSWWIAAGGHVASGGGAWPLEGWVVVAVWAVAAVSFALWAWRRDTKRV